MTLPRVRIVPDRVVHREKLADTSNARVGHNLTQDAECSMALRFERGDQSRRVDMRCFTFGPDPMTAMMFMSHTSSCCQWL